MKLIDVIIIGAGPAGSVASAYLNKEGYNVVVLEKETMPRFVIGESLLPKCMSDLEESGLIKAVQSQDFQIKTGATFFRGESSLAFEFSEQYTEGWDHALQVKRAKFDKVLIDEAENQGVDVRYECEVKDVETSADIQRVKYLNKEGKLVELESRFLIDASGYGRVLPNLFDLNMPSSLEARGSVFAHVVDSNRTSTAAENIFVHSFNDNKSWIWAIPFLDGTASVGIVGENAFIEEQAKNSGKKFIEFIGSFEDLEGRFKDVELLFEPKQILGYSVGVKKMYGDGYVLCGNSTEFLDPIFSSGVTLATSSGLMAAKLTANQLSGVTVNWDEEYEQKMVHAVEVFRSYIDGWYNGTFQSILFAPKINQDFKNQICSVLAGYVWDKTNPFIKKHKTILATLSQVANF